MGGVGPALCKMGQLTYSMGSSGWEFAPVHQSPPLQVKVFTFENPIIIIETIYTVQQCIITLHFSPLQVKNKPPEGVVNACLYTLACKHGCGVTCE